MPSICLGTSLGFLHVVQILGERLGPACQNDESPRRDGWIGAVQERANGGSRAPMDVWEPFFKHFFQKCEGFLKILESRTENIKLNISHGQ